MTPHFRLWPSWLRRRPRTQAGPRRPAESPPEPPVPSSEEPAATALSGGWHLLGCSVTGADHAANGAGCADYSRSDRFNGGLALVVADGAGSAAHAAEGARLAGDAAAREALDRLSDTSPQTPQAWEDLLREIAVAARVALTRAEAPFRELATTLSLVLLAGDTLAAAQVGDGWIVAERADGTLETVVAPTKGEFFNETVFLTSKGYLDEWSCCVRSAGDVAGVAVISDGLETVACDLASQRPHAGFFAPLFAFARDPTRDPAAQQSELERFLSADRINQRTYDDKTLMLAVRRHETDFSDAPGLS